MVNNKALKLLVKGLVELVIFSVVCAGLLKVIAIVVSGFLGVSQISVFTAIVIVTIPFAQLFMMYRQIRDEKNVSRVVGVVLALVKALVTVLISLAVVICTLALVSFLPQGSPAGLIILLLLIVGPFTFLLKNCYDGLVEALDQKA